MLLALALGGCVSNAEPFAGAQACRLQADDETSRTFCEPEGSPAAPGSALAAPSGEAAALTVPPSLRAGGLDELADIRAGLPAADRPAASARPTLHRLTDAVASAVMRHPEIAASDARVREAAAGIGVARSAVLPSADIRVAAGGNHSGSFEGRALPYRAASNSYDGRFDGGVVLRQLVFDFGAARSDIDRAALQRDAERMKLREKIDEIAHRTVQSYLRILEQRALLALLDETIAAHVRLAAIVQAHAREGHGTIADVQRVNARLVDVRAIRADVSLQLMGAEEQFERNTGARPGRLEAAPDVKRLIPADATAAIRRMLDANPRLAALSATRSSTEKELEYQLASVLPKVHLEVETESKNFRNGQIGRTQIEGRAMLAVRYRIMDGGLGRATEEQIRARIVGQEMTLLNEREQLEADVRQAYRAVVSAERKDRLIGEGVAASRSVRELYLEQFKGGKRTIFELLDGQMSYYTARRTQIEGQFDGRRAVFDILKATGELTLRLARQGAARPAAAALERT